MYLTEAKETVDAALRVIFGSDPSHISLLYLLMYARAAGGFTPLISDKANVGGQEFKVKVSLKPGPVYTSLYSRCDDTILTSLEKVNAVPSLQNLFQGTSLWYRLHGLAKLQSGCI